MLAAYYGLITHIDNQLSRFLTAVEEFDLLENTIFWFVSDHGDQLGEHYLFRKGYPTKGSIKIPAFIFDPGNLIAGTKKSVTQLVKIQDVFLRLQSLPQVKKLKQTVERSPIHYSGNLQVGETNSTANIA